MRHAPSIILALAAAGSLAPAGAAETQVIFTEVPGHPTALVPGAVDLAGKPLVTEFKAMELLSLSPDGSAWIVKGRNHGGADVETMLLLGSGLEGAVLAQEGQPVHDGEPGELYDFFGSGAAHFNELGQFVFTARARDGDSTIKHKGIMWDGRGFVMMRRESDPALGLIDLPPNPSGDELFGNSFGSMHLLDDGQIGYQDSTIQNVHSSRRPAIFYDDTSFRQSGVSAIDGGTWDSLDANTFATTPDGKTWLVEGDDEGATGTDDILVVDDLVVLREGSPVGASTVTMADVFQSVLVANGDWIARGDDPADDDWVARNGAFVTGTGEQIVAAADGGETWSNVIVAVSANRNGDFVIAGKTNSPDVATDDVVVRNGAEILAREGDPVDLDGNGEFDDDAFLGRGNMTSGAFHADDLVITDDGDVYLFASLRNAAGEDLGEFGTGGDAFLRIVAAGLPCPADVDGSGTVDVDDLVAVVLNWGPCRPGPCAGDTNGDESVDVDDLVNVVLGWGDCP